MLRFQFLNQALGPLTIEVDDPIGVNEMTKMIKRSADNDGIVFEVMFDLEFIKGSRRYLKNAFETDGGIDALVLVNVYRLNVNTRKWVIYSTGSVNYNKYDVAEDKITINMEQVGVQRRVTNQMEIDVNLETEVSENGNALPENFVLPTMAMHSKSIIKESTSKPADFTEKQFLDVFEQSGLPGLSTTYRERIIFGQMDTTENEIDELPEGFSTSFGYSDLGGTATVGPLNAAATKVWLEANPDNRTLFPVHKFEEAGVLDIDLVAKIKHEIEAVDISGDIDVCGDAALGEIEIFYWIEIRDAENNIVLLENIGEVDMGACVGDVRESVVNTLPWDQQNISVGIDWQVYWYHTIRIYGDYENQDSGSESVSHHFRIEAEDGYYLTLKSKTSAPASTTKAVLLYEAFQRCCQYYTNDTDCFESDLLGRTDLIKPSTGEPYEADGEASLIVWTNGGNLRKLIDKPIFANLQDLIDFVNSQFCVGFGFETGADGKQRMRLEKRSYFYNKNNKILSLGKVYNVRKTIDSKRYYNSIEFGYASKIDLGQTNAIDAFNTKRRNSIPIINTKNALKIATKVKADGYQIEQARRLQFSTTDGKNDDEPFVVCVIRDGGTFKSQKDEGYSLIENVFDSPTGYNYNISPARSLRNWFKIIASALIYAKSKVIKFTFGEVNFLMRTQKTGETFVVEENGNVDLTDVEPDYDNFIYELKDVDITDDLVQEICDNPYGYIDFEDQFGEVMEGYISDNGIEHDQFKGKADFKLLKVYRP
jgi:hypothetical protein